MLNNFYKGKKVFITGHTGFKGSWLTQVLLMLGAEVCGYSLEPNTVPSLFEYLELDKKIHHHIADIRDYKHLRQVLLDFNPEIVFHLAAQPLVRESYLDPISTYEINVIGTVHLLNVIRDCSHVKSVINITTDKVYRNKETQKGYQESDELCGFDPYSNSKSCSELVTDCFINSYLKEKGIAVSTLRAGNVIGGGDFSKDRIIPDCVRYTLAERVIEVRNPNSVRPYQHVLESIFAYIFIAMKQFNDYNLAGSYNIGPRTSDNLSTGELADFFCKSWGMPAKWSTVENKGPHEANLLMLDCTKIKKTFNWSPILDAQQAIFYTVELSKALAMDINTQKTILHQINNYKSQFEQRMKHE